MKTSNEYVPLVVLMLCTVYFRLQKGQQFNTFMHLRKGEGRRV